jgi:hypothetical protein
METENVLAQRILKKHGKRKITLFKDLSLGEQFDIVVRRQQDYIRKHGFKKFLDSI